MRIIFIIFIIIIISAACAPFKTGENKERGLSSITIILDRVNDHFSKSSVEELEGQASRRRSSTFNKKVIYKAQKNLTQFGYDPGPLDGIWGPKTEKAIKKFQQDNRLVVTGNLDEQTCIHLVQNISACQESVKDSISPAQQYTLMTPGEARQVIEEHIKNNDIKLETYAVYRKFSKNSESEVRTEVFQGIRFDSKNYIVIALCEPAYTTKIPSEDIKKELAKLKIDIPDNSLSFTFNGLLYSTVDLKVKTNPVFSYTEQNGFISNNTIPKGGYEWLFGEYGMRLGNKLIMFHTPLNKNFLRSLISEPNMVVVELSSQKGSSIFLNLYRQ